MATLTKSAVILVLLASVCLSGCIYTASLDRSPYVNRARLREHLAGKPSVDSDDVQLLRRRPSRPHVVLGTLHAPDVEWTAHYTTDDLVKAMRRRAASAGADAIVGFRTRSNPTTHITRSGGTTHAVPYKGLHAWAEAIIYVTPEQKKQIDPQDDRPTTVTRTTGRPNRPSRPNRPEFGSR